MPSGRHHVFSHHGFIDVAAPIDMSCVGPAGADGRDSIVPGPPGQDSIVPGPQGEPGADSTVPGPRGARGPAGKEGATYYSSTVRKVSENVSKMPMGFSESVALGDVVRVSGESIASKAIASGSDPAAMAIGLVSAALEIQTSGPFTNDAWSLTPGEVYYLSATEPGGITSTRPQATGDYIVIVGFASATTTLVISIHHAIKLET